MKITNIDINSIKENPDNPRTIGKVEFEKLVKSIKNFPQMLSIRPIVVNNEMIVLGGNMRLRACKQAGLLQVPIIKAEDLTPEQQKEFIIKDNVGFGAWDWDKLANDFELEQLSDWGLEPIIEDTAKQDPYTSKITAPVYEPKLQKPHIFELYNLDKYNHLCDEINKLDIPDTEKQFLIHSCSRHIVFNYEKIAEYYAHSEKTTQEAFELLTLVIIDFNKAIEQGFIKLCQDLDTIYEEEHGKS